MIMIMPSINDMLKLMAERKKWMEEKSRYLKEIDHLKKQTTCAANERTTLEPTKKKHKTRSPGSPPKDPPSVSPRNIIGYFFIFQNICRESIHGFRFQNS